MATILVVDDERLICELLHVVLSSQGHEVLIASNGEQALSLFAKRRPRLTLLDICMPGLDGIEVLRQIHWMDPLAAVMIRSEEHTSELQSQFHLVCRLLLEKKKKYNIITYHELY